MGFSVVLTEGTPELRADMLVDLDALAVAAGFTQVTPDTFSVTFPYTDDVRYYFVLFCDQVRLLKMREDEKYLPIQAVINVAVPFNATFPVGPSPV